jgi:hypothetical protein
MVLGDQNDIPASAAVMYAGSAIGLTSGYARQLVAGDEFAGFAQEKVDNSDGSAGDINTRVARVGRIVLTVVGASAVTDYGSSVYASDGATFTLTKASNTYIGKVARWVTSTTCEVDFNALAVEIGSEDILLANGKVIQTDTTTAHTFSLSAYDVDGSTRPAMVTLTNANAPTLTLSPAAANGIGMYGATPATQAATVADVATNLASGATASLSTLSVAINGIFADLEAIGIRASA